MTKMIRITAKAIMENDYNNKPSMAVIITVMIYGNDNANEQR